MFGGFPGEDMFSNMPPPQPHFPCSPYPQRTLLLGGGGPDSGGARTGRMCVGHTRDELDPHQLPRPMGSPVPPAGARGGGPSRHKPVGRCFPRRRSCWLVYVFHGDLLVSSELHVRTDLDSRGDDSLTVSENLWPVGAKGPQTHVVESLPGPQSSK